MWALLVVLCSSSASSIRLNQSTSAKGEGRLLPGAALRPGADTSDEDLVPFPSVVISGIGDSGTTAVLRAIRDMGLWLCGTRDGFEEPPISHKNRKSHIQRLLDASEGEMTHSAFKRNKTEFKESVRWLRGVAQHEAACIKDERQSFAADKRWGFKEPHYVWLLPVMDVAYKNHTHYLVVARDPRDICTNKLQDQYKAYAPSIGAQDCYTWWATLWQNLLDAYEAEPRFAVVRIEDLVLHRPKSAAAYNVMRCLVNFTGMEPAWPEMHEALSMMRLESVSADLLSLYGRRLDPSEDRLRTELMRDPQKTSRAEAERQQYGLHLHNSSYLGHHYGFTEERRARLREQVVNRTDIHPVMRRLGYDPLDLHLLAPTSPAVLCRPA
eukprot:CAMPEP_0171106222 /NCGR_PEP_ID=MMETSP0766_2-20121228/64301_1 /TAXON_ID=439317 /ORGANISM="Gambierdiscus australes, Strain CAWD 149" /LENGTH=381 /DNA_ID=CAMNT_0011567269 /DNA_START=65 /DNA_END=1210 /DNA_ORIENTATION=-